MELDKLHSILYCQHSFRVVGGRSSYGRRTLGGVKHSGYGYPTERDAVSGNGTSCHYISSK